MSYLNIRGLHKSYGATPIFTDINIEIGQGQFITLLGPSGCGTPTFLLVCPFFILSTLVSKSL